MECRVCVVRDLPPMDAETCAETLCKPGSEMQREFYGGVATTPVAVVYDGVVPVAWAASHVWSAMQTLEGFTRRTYRRRGLQRFAACGLLARRVLDPAKPVAVFADECVGLTRWLGFVEPRLYLRDERGQWRLVPR